MDAMLSYQLSVISYQLSAISQKGARLAFLVAILAKIEAAKIARPSDRGKFPGTRRH